MEWGSDTKFHLRAGVGMSPNRLEEGAGGLARRLRHGLIRP